jgi:hypothetical protein
VALSRGSDSSLSALEVLRIIPGERISPSPASLAYRDGAMPNFQEFSFCSGQDSSPIRFIADSFGSPTMLRGKDYWRHEEDQSGPKYR